MFVEHVPHIPLAYATSAMLVSDKVEGYVIEPTGWARFHKVKVRR